MKCFQNKRVKHANGTLSYYFVRAMPNGRLYRYVLHLSQAEQKNGRWYIAGRVRMARANLAECIKEEMRHASPRR